MKAHATVPTEDLASALDYLDGLVVLLELLADRREAKDASSKLLTALQTMDSAEMSWEPLRYQRGVGMGWTYVAENIRELRERLLTNYGEAAL